MLAKSEAVNVLRNNIDDPRVTVVTLQLMDLIERKMHGGGIPQFRITDTNTGNLIKSVDELKAAFVAKDIKYTYVAGTEKGTIGGGRLLAIMCYNLKVELNKNAESDAELFRTRNNGEERNNLSFVVGYMNDGDPDVPLKFVDFRLM